MTGVLVEVAVGMLVFVFAGVAVEGTKVGVNVDVDVLLTDVLLEVAVGNIEVGVNVDVKVDVALGIVVLVGGVGVPPIVI